MILTNKTEINKALSLYDRGLFWEYGESEIPKLGAELVVPRVTRYGTLEDIVRLFLIFPVELIQRVVANDRELDKTEKTFFNYLFINGSSLLNSRAGFDYGDSFTMPAHVIEGIEMTSLLDIGLMKLDVQNRRSAWKDLIDLNAITDIHPLIELISVYNLRYPPMPVKQCYMSLVKNLENPPSISEFPVELMFNNSTPESIISSLKKKCLEVYESILQQQRCFIFTNRKS